MSGSVYFFARDVDHGRELWKTDGTAAGTVMVKDINPGMGGSYASSLTNLNGVLYFSAYDGTNGHELWRSDGTTAGTVMVKNIFPGAGDSTPAHLTNVNGILYFQATDGTNGIELWKSDGTAAGTVLVKDIYSGAGHATPAHLTNVNGVLYFTATDGATGVELWKSDGTGAGTVMVKDINPGAGDSIINSSNSNALAVNGVLYFAANDGTHGAELWKSDGTGTGTVLVKDIDPLGNCGLGGADACGSAPSYLTNVNGVLFFAAADGGSNFIQRNTELWRSDGTASGTVMVKDVNPGMASSGLIYLTNVNGILYFTASDGTNGYEVWKSDGAVDGTVPVKDIWPGTSSSFPGRLASAGGMLYFQATDQTHGSELWRSDGSAPGTMLVKDIDVSTASSQPMKTVEVNGTLFFAANDGVNGTELWMSDGTGGGTLLVKDIKPGTDSCFYSSGQFDPQLTAVNGTVFFIADDGTHGKELWKSDGTEAGTTLVRDIRPGADSPFTALSSGTTIDPRLTAMNGTVYFVADDGTHGIELWKSDGTEAGTAMVIDLFAGAYDSYPRNLAEMNGTLYFSAYHIFIGDELWKTDGTVAGTFYFDLSPGSELYGSPYSSSPADLTKVNGVLYFTANDGMHGKELWKSDGTWAGTGQVKDIRSGSLTSSPSALTGVNGVLYFAANDGTNGTELWKSDGTGAGTQLVKDIQSGSGSSSPSSLVEAGGTLYFSAYDATNGIELWKSDGTGAGTVLVKDIFAGPGHASPSSLTSTGSGVYFIADDGTHGGELWKSDGTPAGTMLVEDLYPGAAGALDPYFASLTHVNGLLYFTAIDPSAGNELWAVVSDETPPTQPGTPTDEGFTGQSPVAFAWTAANDAESGIQGYDLQVGTVSGGNDVFDGSVGNVLSMNVAGANGQTFYARVRAINGVGLTGPWSGSSDGILIDTMAPVTTASPSGGVYFTAQSVTLSCNDGAGSGCAATYYCLGSGCMPSTPYAGPVAITGPTDLRFFSVDGAGHTEAVVTRNYVISYELVITKVGSGSGAVAGSLSGMNCGATCSQVYAFNDVETLTVTPDASSLFIGWAGDADCADGVVTMTGSRNCTAVFSRALKDIVPGAGGSDPANLTAATVSNKMYFAATDPVSGTELWRSDGTTAGTVLAMDINPGPASSNPSNFVVIGSTLYFTADDGIHGIELWKSDGLGNTMLVKDITPGPTGTGPLYLRRSGAVATLFFVADDGVTGYELWKSDGTEAGTVQVMDINAGAPGSIPSLLTNVSGTLFFAANDGVHGGELWKSDGTPAGTAMVEDINLGGGGASLDSLTAVNGVLFFTAEIGEMGRNIWKSDGTGAGTLQVSSGGFSVPSELINVNGVVYFSAYDGNGNELWKSDGTEAGTVLTADINPGTASSFPQRLTNVNGVVFLSSDDGTHGVELLKSDGTGTGTVLVKDINPGPGGSNPSNLINVNGVLYFTADDGENGIELWKSDGTDMGTVIVDDIAPGAGGSGPLELARMNGMLFFSSSDGYAGRELWAVVTDFSGPSVPGTPTDGGDTSASLDVTFSWTAATDAESGIRGYNLQVGTAPDGNDVLDQYVGNAVSTNMQGSHGQTLYARVQAVNRAGITGEWSPSSDGILISLSTFTMTGLVSGGNGTLLPVSQGVPEGYAGQITLVPDPGYHSIIVNNTCGGGKVQNLFTSGPVTADCTVTFAFEMNTLTLLTAGNGAGAILSSPTSTLPLNCGVSCSAYYTATAVSLTAIPNDGSTFTGWSGNCSGTNPVALVNVVGPRTCTAAFTAMTFTVTASAGEHGNVAPLSQIVTYGATANVTVTPDPGYHLTFITGCGGMWLGENPYTTDQITGPCEVTATFGNAAATVPALVVPSGGSEVMSITPTLQATSTDPDGDPVLYIYEVSATSDFASISASSGGVAGAWEVSPALSDNTSYWWRVRATDGLAVSADMSPASFFVNTANDMPIGPDVSGPSDGSQVATLTPTLSVTNASDADLDTLTYEFQVTLTPSPDTMVASVTGVPQGSGTTSWATPALVENTLYYWRSRAMDSHGLAGDWTGGRFFVNTANDPPAVPVLSSPSGGGETTTLLPELAVNASTDPESDPVTYRFELDTVNTFDSPGKQSIADTQFLTWTPAALSDNTTYYWRSKASDGSAESAWMPTATFFVNQANDAPSMITVNYPSAMAEVTVLAPELSVNAATDPDNDAVTYEYEIYENIELTVLAASMTGAGPSWTVSPALADNTWYLWRVRARDEHGAFSPWITASYFFVNNSGYNDPPSVTLLAPGPAEPVAYSASYSIRWSDSDPDNDAAITLGYDTVGASNNCAGTTIASGIRENDPANSYAWNISGLAYNTSYWVYAVIDDGVNPPVCAYAQSALVKGDPGSLILAVGKEGTGSGVVTSSPAGIDCGGDCSEVYGPNSAVSLIAAADGSSHFTGWSGDADCADGVITVSAAKTCTAGFSLNSYTVNAITDPNGGVDAGTPSPAAVIHGGSTGFTFNAATGYHVASIESTCGGTGYTNSSNAVTSYTYATGAVTGDCTVFGSFAVNTYALGVTRTGTGVGTVTSAPAGISCGSDCLEVHPYGAVVTLTAEPDSKSKFNGWSGACSGTGTCQVTMDATRNAIAEFALLKAESVTLGASPVSPAASGTTVTLTAQGQGGLGVYEYRFYRKNPGDSSYTMVRDYTGDNILLWDTTGYAGGTYTLMVYVRNLGSTAAYEAAKSIGYIVQEPPASAATITAPAGPVVKGAPVTFTAGGEGGSGTYQYKFWRKNPGATSYIMVQAYGTNNTWTWDTTGAVTGTHTVMVYVRNAGSVAAYEAYKSMTYIVQDPAATGATLGALPASPQPAGTPVTFTAGGQGGTGTYEYRFYRKNPGSSTWTQVQAYGTNNEWLWDTTGAAAGTHSVMVYVRNQGSVAAYEAIKTVTYTVQ